MKRCNEECEYFKSLANTNETNSALCTYINSYFPIDKDAECVIMPREYTCGDCDRFGKDDWCMSCQAEDTASPHGKLCCGFVDKRESDVFNALFDWTLRGYNVEEKLNKVLETFQKEYKKL